VPMNNPPLPASDTMTGDSERGWYSYGPRVLRDDYEVEPPYEGETPAFWGIYRWNQLGHMWYHIIDVAHAHSARRIVNRLRYNPNYTPEPMEIIA